MFHGAPGMLEYGMDQLKDLVFDLITAADAGRADPLAKAIEQGIPRKIGPNRCSLIMACACDENHIEAVAAWLPAFTAGFVKNEDGSTHEDPLEMAARHGRKEIVELLLSKYGPGEGLDMPLYVAASHGQLDMVKRLVEAGADPQAVDSSALVVAAKRSQHHVIAFLAPLCNARRALAQCEHVNREGVQTLAAFVNAIDLGQATALPSATRGLSRL